jgi:hypothetical protein
MLATGKHFAIAAILAIFLGFVRWPQPATGFYALTIKNRVYGFGWDYRAFSVGAFLLYLLPSTTGLQLFFRTH